MKLYKSDAIKAIFISFFMVISFEVLTISLSLMYQSLSHISFFKNELLSLIVYMFFMIFSYSVLIYIFKKKIINFTFIKFDTKLSFFYYISLFFAGIIASYFTLIFFTYFDNIPISPSEIAFQKLIAKYPWYGIIMALVIAPIFEELFFRKYILSYLLVNLEPAYAIMISAFLFGAFHLNIRQFILASALGLLLAYVYYKTRDIKNSMFLHFSYNFVAFVPLFNEEHIKWSTILVAALFMINFIRVNKNLDLR